jgi:hypothetical protein
MVLALTAASAQKTIDYNNPYFEFENVASIAEVTMDHLFEIDLSKLTYTKDTSGGTVRYYTLIPFYVNKKITGSNDFNFSMYYGPSWSILNSKKEALVYSFEKLRNEEGEIIGVRQLNGNLKTPVTTPGLYYIKLIVDKKPIEEDTTYIFVGRMQE